VNEEGKGKRNRQTVKEARNAVIKRMREEHETSAMNAKRKKTRKHLEPKAIKFVQKVCERYTKGPNGGTQEWILCVDQINRVAKEADCPALLYVFIRNIVAKLEINK